VVLAAGLGKRMRREDPDASLDDRQVSVARTGVKALIPIDRPFLDYVLTNVAEAGYRSVCLVTGPDHHELRRYYKELPATRLRFEFAIQEKPLGTADALAAAADFAGGDPFLLINSDNYYPASALKALRELDGNGLAGFTYDSFIRGSNIPPERLAAFAIIEADEDGYLTRIVEKPGEEEIAKAGPNRLVSMNCWRFNSSIFEACRSIELSPRGEYEIPDAVMYSIASLGQRYKVVRSDEAVLDLSHRSDVEPVSKRLKGVEVSL